MFVRSTKVKGNRYFYLVESERVEGKTYPAQRMIEYLGNQDNAIAKLEASDYPDKEHLLAKVKAAVPMVGKGHGRRGRPRKEGERSESTGAVDR